MKEAECKALFERWYAEYPRKEDPGRARRAFDKALGKTDFDTLFAGVGRYAAEVRQKGTERQYIKHPTTWLNAEAWRNEADLVDPPDPLLKWRHRLGMWSKDGYWNSMTWGPEPGQPGCDVPAELLTETRQEVAHANG